MISNKLKNIFALSIPVFIAHGIEEFLTHFYDIDAHNQAIFGLLSSLSNHGATFVVFQIMFWLILIISYFLIRGERWRLRLMFIPAIIFMYEFHHLYKAVSIGGYYPGTVTAVLLCVIGFFFWKELLKNYQLANFYE